MSLSTLTLGAGTHVTVTSAGRADKRPKDDLETRLGEVEHVQSRLAEIEERLDFTERLLATRRDADRLSPPSA